MAGKRATAKYDRHCRGLNHRCSWFNVCFAQTKKKKKLFFDVGKGSDGRKCCLNGCCRVDQWTQIYIYILWIQKMVCCGWTRRMMVDILTFISTQEICFIHNRLQLLTVRSNVQSVPLRHWKHVQPPSPFCPFSELVSDIPFLFSSSLLPHSTFQRH